MMQEVKNLYQGRRKRLELAKKNYVVIFRNLAKMLPQSLDLDLLLKNLKFRRLFRLRLLLLLLLALRL
jgi:hypothetical protein